MIFHYVPFNLEKMFIPIKSSVGSILYIIFPHPRLSVGFISGFMNNLIYPQKSCLFIIFHFFSLFFTLSFAHVNKTATTRKRKISRISKPPTFRNVTGSMFPFVILRSDNVLKQEGTTTAITAATSLR